MYSSETTVEYKITSGDYRMFEFTYRLGHRTKNVHDHSVSKQMDIDINNSTENILRCWIYTCFMRLLAMWPPMLPKPMNPILDPAPVDINLLRMSPIWTEFLLLELHSIRNAIIMFIFIKFTHAQHAERYTNIADCCFLTNA